MKRLAHAGVAGLVVTLLVVAPTTAARPSDCTLDLDVAPIHEYGETVVMHVSGLPGTGGVDIFTPTQTVFPLGSTTSSWAAAGIARVRTSNAAASAARANGFLDGTMSHLL